MDYLETQRRYFSQFENEQVQEVDDGEPALALDLRINCASASISIFDDRNFLMNSAISDNERIHDYSLTTNRDRRNEENTFTPFERVQRSQLLPILEHQQVSYDQPYRRSLDSLACHPSASFSRFLAPERLWEEPEDLDRTRDNQSMVGVQSTIQSCPCSISVCCKCQRPMSSSRTTSKLPLSAVVQRDRSRSPIVSSQNPQHLMADSDQNDTDPSGLFTKSPPKREDDFTQGTYIHKRFNARSIFLRRVIQRQQDHSIEKIPESPSYRANSPTFKEQFQNELQTSPKDTGFIPSNVSPEIHNQHYSSILPHQVDDIDSKLNIIEKSLVNRRKNFERHEMKQETFQNNSSYYHQRHTDLGAESCEFQPLLSNMSPPLPQGRSTSPLNLSKDNEMMLEKSQPVSPHLASRDLPQQRELQTLHSPREKFRTPSPAAFHTTETSDDETPKDQPVKPEKNRRGRPRKHIRKIPLPPLYVFIRNLLHNNSYNPDIVKWINESSGTFKVINTMAFAKTWGQMKSNRSEEMNYEKMSRAMRYHYGSPSRKGHLAMVKEKRLVYRFGELAINWRVGDVHIDKCKLHDLCKGCLCLWTKE